MEGGGEWEATFQGASSAFQGAPEGRSGEVPPLTPSPVLDPPMKSGRGAQFHLLEAHPLSAVDFCLTM